MSAPNSQINICSGVRLNHDYIHTIWFSSLNEQVAYFSGKVVKTFSGYTFLRKSWSIKVATTMEQAQTWSYLYFRNGSGKHYFYFINNIEYINDETVELFLEMDVMQTYAFDYTLLRSFVDREHVSDDAIGKNLVDEKLELGDFKVIDETVSQMRDLCILVQATYNPINTTEENTDTVLGALYNNTFSGLGIYAVNALDWASWGAKLKLLDEYGKSDGIISMWMYPKSLVRLHTENEWSDGEVVKSVAGTAELYTNVSRNTTLSGGYKPRNNKLFTYPYNFLYVTNNTGSSAVYKYEYFGDPSFCNFKVLGALSPDANAKMYPINYKGHQHNYDEGLTLGGFPSCAWNQDVYKLWLAQNQNQHTYAAAGAVLKIAGGVIGTVVSGGIGAAIGGGAIIGGATQIGQMMAQQADKEIQPPQAKGQSSGSVNVANGFQVFSLIRKSISEEFARMIDDYFDLYGYKVNAVKVPNRAVRENWTYTKTVDCSIKGNFCTEDQKKIQDIFNKGITFWKNGDSIGDYSLPNNPI